MAEDLPSVVVFSVDLGKQEAPEPLPVGDYDAVIRAATVRISQKDTRYAEVMFFISADQYPPDYTEGNPEGTTIAYRRVGLEDHPNARYGCRRFLEAIDAPVGKKINVDDWMGRTARVEVGSDTYEGVTRPVINRVHPVS
jgi:hypothetical protein